MWLILWILFVSYCMCSYRLEFLIPYQDLEEKAKLAPISIDWGSFAPECRSVPFSPVNCSMHLRSTLHLHRVASLWEILVSEPCAVRSKVQMSACKVTLLIKGHLERKEKQSRWLSCRHLIRSGIIQHVSLNLVKSNYATERKQYSNPSFIAANGDQNHPR